MAGAWPPWQGLGLHGREQIKRQVFGFRLEDSKRVMVKMVYREGVRSVNHKICSRREKGVD